MICKTILLLNLTTLPITQQDAKVIPTAIKTCSQSQMCPKSITKKEEDVFHVVCHTPPDQQNCDKCINDYINCFEGAIKSRGNMNACLPIVNKCLEKYNCKDE